MKLERLADEWNLWISRKPKAFLELVESPQCKPVFKCDASSATPWDLNAYLERLYSPVDILVDMELACSRGEQDAAWLARGVRIVKPIASLLAIILGREIPNVDSRASREFSDSSFVNMAFGYIRQVEHAAQGNSTIWKRQVNSYLFGARYAFSAARMPNMVGLVDFIVTNYNRDLDATLGPAFN